MGAKRKKKIFVWTLSIFLSFIIIFDASVRYWVVSNRNSGLKNYVESYNFITKKHVSVDNFIYNLKYSATCYLSYLLYQKFMAKNSQNLHSLSATAYKLEMYTSKRKNIGITRLDIKPFLLFCIAPHKDRKYVDSIVAIKNRHNKNIAANRPKNRTGAKGRLRQYRGVV